MKATLGPPRLFIDNPAPPAAQQRGSIVLPVQIDGDLRRTNMWLYCYEVRQRWDAWEAEEIAAGRIEDTRRL